MRNEYTLLKTPMTMSGALDFVEQMKLEPYRIQGVDPKVHRRVLRFLKKQIKQIQHPSDEITDLISKMREMIAIVSSPKHQLLSGWGKGCCAVTGLGVYWLLGLMQFLFYVMSVGCDIPQNACLNITAPLNVTAPTENDNAHYPVLGLYAITLLMTTVAVLLGIFVFDSVKTESSKLRALYLVLPDKQDWPSELRAELGMHSHTAPTLV